MLGVIRAKTITMTQEAPHATSLQESIQPGLEVSPQEEEAPAEMSAEANIELREADTDPDFEAILDAEEEEVAELEPQPGVTSARTAPSGAGRRAKPFRSQKSRADSIDTVNAADLKGQQPRQVTISFTASDFATIERLQAQISEGHSQELTPGEIVRLALRCFEPMPGACEEEEEEEAEAFQPRVPASEMALTG